MKTLWVSACLVTACCGCGGTVDDTRPAAPSAREDIQVTVQWPPNKNAIEIPFELLEDIPVIRCQLDGAAAVLYVDTACQPICLYEDRLARFGLKVTSEKDHPRYTAGGPVEKTRYCGAFTLTFPDRLSLKVSGAPCVLGEGRSPGHDVDGILGVKIMKALNAVLDFEAGKMTFTVKAASNKIGAANGSQPFRSEANRTSSAAGSRR